jgi:hypothetical protein
MGITEKEQACFKSVIPKDKLSKVEFASRLYLDGIMGLAKKIAGWEPGQFPAREMYFDNLLNLLNHFIEFIKPF